MFYELDMQVIKSCLSRKAKSNEQTEQEKTAEKPVPLLSIVGGENQGKEDLAGLLFVLSMYRENYTSFLVDNPLPHPACPAG